ncbi:hypothetical protein F9L48_22500 [Escherichia coli]|nr:hypothetical protein [Escherichia coli]EFB5266137.1 hypothetical protein [Escherichia coli]EFE7354943.1 hypothetical protein [Escherichia coli]EFF1044491.1 hypothetical protein [Escherichia coli]EFH9012064.1 hypothetical protein [Escherichia coli]
MSAPEIPHTSGKRGLPSPPGSLLPCFVGQSYLHHCISAYFHERRSLNNFHRDRVITFEQIAE